jgi:glycosyltransferase involved in cell wall biosynthesis
MSLLPNDNKIKPFLIVAMPCYNEERLISNVLKSILDQTLSDFHLYVFDNASTDNTREILKKFSQMDRRVKAIYFDRHISGLSNINRCLQCIPDSKYTALRAANDIINPEYLKRTIEILESDTLTALAYSPGVLYDSMKGLFFHNEREVLINAVDTDLYSRAEQVISRYSSPYPFWGVYRRDVIRKMQFDVDCHGTDHIFVCEAAIHGLIKKTDDILEYKTLPITPLKTHYDVWKSWHPSSLWKRDENSVFSDINLRLPFLSMIDGHLKMFHRIPLADAEKLTLQNIAIRSITNRFRPFLLEEANHLKSLVKFQSTVSLNNYSYLNECHLKHYECLSNLVSRYI